MAQQHATITGQVNYTPGDGAAQTIPKGPVNLDFSDNSVTLSWTADNGAACSAAIPRDNFDRRVSEGKIEYPGSSDKAEQGKP